MDTTYAIGCHRRVENRVWPHGAGLWPGPKGKGQGRALAGFHRDKNVLGLVSRQFGLVVAMTGNAGRCK